MWKKGRLNGGYEKITIIKRGFRFWKMLGFDLHIIRYLTGTYIPEHIDKVEEGNHHRFNFILHNPRKGGEFHCEKYKKWWRFIYFRPDLYKHSVTECLGTRYLISFGVVLK